MARNSCEANVRIKLKRGTWGYRPNFFFEKVFLRNTLVVVSIYKIAIYVRIQWKYISPAKRWQICHRPLCWRWGVDFGRSRNQRLSVLDCPEQFAIARGREYSMMFLRTFLTSAKFVSLIRNMTLSSPQMLISKVSDSVSKLFQNFFLWYRFRKILVSEKVLVQIRSWIDPV